MVSGLAEGREYMEPTSRAKSVGKEVRAVRPLQKLLLLDVLRDKESRLVFY